MLLFNGISTNGCNSNAVKDVIFPYAIPSLAFLSVETVIYLVAVWHLEGEIPNKYHTVSKLLHRSGF